jgi:hypothetical protein
VTVNVADPLLFGIPEITPVDEFREAHEGSAPTETEKVYGDAPPPAAIVRL